MSEQIPAHYHKLPKTTGTNTVYPDGLPLWDANGKRMVIGDGVTPGGIPQAKQEDDTTYNRRFVSENVTTMNRDWVIVKASCTVILPAESDSVLQSVRVSALADDVSVAYTDITNVLYTLQKGMTIEYVCAAGGVWEVVEAPIVPDFSRYLSQEALQFNGASDTQISFKQMTYEQYADSIAFAEPVKDAIYYITDTKQIIVNGISYVADVLVFVESFPQIGASGKLYWNTTTGELKCYENGKWLTSNLPITTVIDSTTSDYYVPTAKAVHTFVTETVPKVVTPLDGLIISFKNGAFEAQPGYFYICTVSDKECTLPTGKKGDIMRFMTKNCAGLLIKPASGVIIHDDTAGKGILLDMENATVTLYRDDTGWSIISY